MRRERGFAIAGFAAALAALAIVFVAGEMALLGRTAAEGDAARREAYLDEAAAAVASWYARNAAAVDADAAFPIPEDEIPEAAGVPPRWGLRAAASARLSSGGIVFRRIVLWVPAQSPDPSSWDPAAGIFSPGPGVLWRVVDGQAVQGAAYAATLKAMQRFAAQLEERFHALAAADGPGSLAVNYFRPRSGCAAGPSEIPCLDVYTAADAVDWVAILGVPAGGLRTAWGGPFLVSNLEDSSAVSPPYSMAIAADTPWGARVKVMAVQPL